MRDRDIASATANISAQTRVEEMMTKARGGVSGKVAKMDESALLGTSKQKGLADLEKKEQGIRGNKDLSNSQKREQLKSVKAERVSFRSQDRERSKNLKLRQRGKIGVSPQRATNVMGSYEDVSGTLTIIKFNKPANETNYVNSKFEIQDNPFKGDVINSYNDGPPEPSFYELESSSPAAALGIGDKITHEQYTFHFEGNETELNTISMKILGVSLEEISMIFK